MVTRNRDEWKGFLKEAKAQRCVVELLMTTMNINSVCRIILKQEIHVINQSKHSCLLDFFLRI